MWKRTKLQYDMISKKVVLPKSKDVIISNPQWLVYLRVSTEEQKRTGHWLERQLGNCEVWTERENPKVKIVQKFSDEAVSWTDLSRSGLLKAIEFLEKQNKNELKIHYFICDTSSRLSRSDDIWETFNIVSRIQKTWAKLVTVGKWWIRDTKTETWLLSLWIDFIIDAVESQRSRQRSLGWSINRLRAWYRPFPSPPLWYRAVKQTIWGKENIILELDESKADILREWLTKFANWTILTKAHLYNFFVKKGLRSNSRKNKKDKLHPSIIDKILDTWKLYVYAGYIIYPDWGINELIEGKHPAIISLDIFDRIIRRLEKDKTTTDISKKKYDTDLHEYPLKRILLCSECWKPVTKWKSKSHTWDYHHYYGCNNYDEGDWKKCSLFKKWLPRDLVHIELKEKLKSLSPDDTIVEVFKNRMKHHWNQRMKDKEFEKNNKLKRANDIGKEMEKISKSLDEIFIPELSKERQERWALLRQEKSDIEEDLESPSLADIQYQKLLDMALTVIINPMAIRNLNKPHLIQLLIQVCFNGKIYYKKREWLHTPELSVIYTTFEQLNALKTPNLEMARVELASKRHI